MNGERENVKVGLLYPGQGCNHVVMEISKTFELI